jgi:hypothetical protein
LRINFFLKSQFSQNLIKKMMYSTVNQSLAVNFSRGWGSGGGGGGGGGGY